MQHLVEMQQFPSLIISIHVSEESGLLLGPAVCPLVQKESNLSMCLGSSCVLNYYLCHWNLLLAWHVYKHYSWMVYIKLMLCGWVVIIQVMLTVYFRSCVVNPFLKSMTVFSIRPVFLGLQMIYIQLMLDIHKL